MGMLGLLSCSEYDVRANENTDVFSQETRNMVDILLVIDNSCSMVDEQEKLAANFEGFIEAFAGVDVDYQIAVVTTDQQQEHHMGRIHCAAAVLGDAEGPFDITAGVNDELQLSFGEEMVSFTIPSGSGQTADQVADGLTWGAGLGDYGFATGTDAEHVWITTEMPCAEAYIEVGGGSANDTLGLESGDSMTGARFITPTTENAADHFAANVHVGPYGSGWEQGMQGAYLALTAGYEENDGFLREWSVGEPAALSIVFISDEEDQSPEPVSYYLDYFYDAKSSEEGWEAYRDDTILDISAVVGDVPDGCEQELGGDVYPAQPGYRYIDLAVRTGGVFDSICNEDFSPMVAQLGLNISGLRSKFELSKYPDELTLVVSLQQDGALEETQEGWIYDCDKNAILFDGDHIPPDGSDVHVKYTVVSRPADGACGGGE